MPLTDPTDHLPNIAVPEHIPEDEALLSEALFA